MPQTKVKIRPVKPVDNAHIIKVLGQLVDHIKIQHVVEGDRKHVFRLRNIKKAKDYIESMDTELKTVAQLNGVHGIGDGVKRRVTEIMKTRTLKELEDDSCRGILELLEVYGLGQVKVGELVAQGITCLKELREALAAGKIKLNDSTVIALRYHDEIIQRLQHDYIQRVDQYLKQHIPANYDYVICGSYRRKRRTSGDIDLLVRQLDGGHNLQPLYRHLTELGFLKVRLAGNHTKYNGICEFEGHHCRIDFLLTKPEEFYPALVHFTGSGPFNVRIRFHANNNGYKLSNLGLWSRVTGEQIHVSSEREIFEILKYPYVEPEKR